MTQYSLLSTPYCWLSQTALTAIYFHAHFSHCSFAAFRKSSQTRTHNRESSSSATLFRVQLFSHSGTATGVGRRRASSRHRKYLQRREWISCYQSIIREWIPFHWLAAILCLIFFPCTREDKSSIPLAAEENGAYRFHLAFFYCNKKNEKSSIILIKYWESVRLSRK